MTTIIIEDNSQQAKDLLNFIRTLPYAKVIEGKKKSFREAAEECCAVPVDIFIGELRRQIDEHI